MAQRPLHRRPGTLLPLLLALLAPPGGAQEGKDEKLGAKNLVQLPEGFVREWKLPDGGRRPSVMRASDGAIHLVYLSGEPAAADLWYRVSRDGGESFSEALRVNAREKSADFGESVQGPSLSVGEDGLAHVLWRGAADGEAGPELRYARLLDGAFEPARALVSGRPALGSCADLAVDLEGRVFVLYTDLREGAADAEDPQRRLFMLVSPNGGSLWSEPRPVDPPAHGVSPDSEISAAVSRKGSLHVAYRAAILGKRKGARLRREARLLTSKDGGDSFKTTLMAGWNRRVDPRSSVQLRRGEGLKLLATWEDTFQVFWSPVVQDRISWPLDPKPVDPNRIRRHSAVGENAGNEAILTWIERRKDQPVEESMLMWEVYDKERRVRLGRGRVHGVKPEQAAVFTRADGGFTVVW